MEAPHSFSIANTPLPVWSRVAQVDAGWLYMILNGDLLKVGKTREPARRLREARTWLPKGLLVGMKPFWDIHTAERTLLCGLANCWIEGEWHQLPDPEMYETLLDDFRKFDDHDRNRNSVDFHYWIGSSGMGELVMEQNRRRISLRKWQHEA
ncbi:hypothetical protein [Mesorhizobium sp. CA12]|uniref:hypothetical protein n=1 Tax=Mesorhizobium sp. CA12 TaxID=2876644 RepID=UPI001CCDD9D7|nr:hypothetical protein [Mesorhizobium sp. CA12]MBZ9860007.1 hypothetical protein [Mesorhizobium sp. CA12]